MNATPRNCFIVRISQKLLKKGGALWRDRVASPRSLAAVAARGRKSKCVTPPKGRKAGETHRKKESEDWTDEAENQPEQNARRPRKIAPSRGICGKKKKTKIKERKCIFSSQRTRKNAQYFGGDFEVAAQAATEISLHEKQTMITSSPRPRPPSLAPLA